MLSPGNVATPATAATVVAPERVPLPRIAPSATVTLPVKPVAVFPCPSSAVTCTAGVMDAPAAVFVGGTENGIGGAPGGGRVKGEGGGARGFRLWAGGLRPCRTLLTVGPGR